jgi:hypothetical protein
MKTTNRQVSLKCLVISVFIILLLLLSVGVNAQGAVLHVRYQHRYSDHVIVPLVDKDVETGIPVMPNEDYVSISLIYPLEEKLDVELDDGNGDDYLGQITVTIIDEDRIIYDTIVLQDWPQSGPVIPLSQDWPQDGLLLIPLHNHPDNDFLCLKIQQDWPQYMISGHLV